MENFISVSLSRLHLAISLISPYCPVSVVVNHVIETIKYEFDTNPDSESPYFSLWNIETLEEAMTHTSKISREELSCERCKQNLLELYQNIWKILCVLERFEGQGLPELFKRTA